MKIDMATQVGWGKTAAEVAKRFAKYYEAAQWQWTAGPYGSTLKHVPNEAAILNRLNYLMLKVIEDVERMGKIPKDGDVSWAQDGLVVRLDSEMIMWFEFQDQNWDFSAWPEEPVVSASNYPSGS